MPSTKPLSGFTGERQTGRGAGSRGAPWSHKPPAPTGEQQKGSPRAGSHCQHPASCTPKRGRGCHLPPCPHRGVLCMESPSPACTSYEQPPKSFPWAESWCPEHRGVSIRHFVGSAPKSYPQPSQPTWGTKPPGPCMKPARGKGLGDAKFPFSMPLFPFLWALAGAEEVEESGERGVGSLLLSHRWAQPRAAARMAVPVPERAGQGLAGGCAWPNPSWGCAQGSCSLSVSPRHRDRLGAGLGMRTARCSFGNHVAELRS